MPEATRRRGLNVAVELQDVKILKRRRWQYLILDEAHMIKNWKSQRWQALLNFSARHRLLITGAPPPSHSRTPHLPATCLPRPAQPCLMSSPRWTASPDNHTAVVNVPFRHGLYLINMSTYNHIPRVHAPARGPG